MLPRERVLQAMQHREPDRVPLDFWATDEVKNRLKKHWSMQTEEELLEHIGCDLRVLKGPTYENRRLADGSILDHWGVRRKLVTYGEGEYRGTYAEVIESPLQDKKTVKEIESYQGWPGTDWVEDRLPEIEELDSEVTRKYAVVLFPDRLDRTAQLKPAMYLRGTTEIFLDMAQTPALAEAIFNRIAEYYLEYNRKIFSRFQGKADIFLMGDDFGMQSGLLVSKQMWRKFFKTNFKKFIDLAHKFGFKVMHHTCGSVRELIPEFIECGLDILQSLQPNARGMDLKELKQEFGRDLTFHGSICIQKVLPFGSPAKVREMVRRQMNAGKPGGGFIICTSHNIQNDTPLANIKALIEAYETYRDY